MSPAEFGRAIKICGAGIGLLAIVYGVGFYSGYVTLLSLLAIITYLGFPYIRSELAVKWKWDIFARTNDAHGTSTRLRGQQEIAEFELHNGYLTQQFRTSTPSNDKASVYGLFRDSEEMNRRRSFCFKEQSGTAPVSVLSPINGPVTRFGHTHGVNKVQRRHSFNVSGRPLSFLNTPTPSNTPGSTVKINPKSRTSALFSPRVFQENEHESTNESRRKEIPAAPLPKVHRLQ